MFGERIQQLREEYGDTQKQLAEYLGVSRQTVSNYEIEKHHPDYDILIKIAKRYNVTVDYLIGNSNIKNYDKYVTNFKNYPKSIINIIESICSLVDNKDLDKIKSLKVILSELNKLI